MASRPTASSGKVSSSLNDSGSEGGIKHSSKLGTDDDCDAMRKRSLNCSCKFGEDARTKCAPLFAAYKDCKKRAGERARAERIEKRNKSSWF